MFSLKIIPFCLFFKFFKTFLFVNLTSISRNHLYEVSAAHHFEVMHNIDTLTFIYYIFSMEYYNKFNFSRITFSFCQGRLHYQNFFPQIWKLRNYTKTNEVLDGQNSLLNSTSSCPSASNTQQKVQANMLKKRQHFQIS
jgi:hypothetical protein